MKLSIRGIPTEHCQRLWSGGPDANGQPALRRTAEGQANPCRHCLDLVGNGQPMLVVAYRPFGPLQPYAEMGPIFLHAEPCVRYQGDALPPWFHYLDPALVRGYGEDDWIRYETARVVPGKALADSCEEILSEQAIAYVHIRSKFNCFQCRVDRG